MTEAETRSVLTYYRTPPAWEPSFWERGNVRYLCLSWSLWARNIWCDVSGVDKKGVRKRPAAWDLRGWSKR